MAKVSRKKLLKQPDEFLTISNKILSWSKVNIRRIVLGVSVVVALLAVILGLRAYNQQHEESGSIAFGKAFNLYQTALSAPLDSQEVNQAITALRNVSQEYASTAGGMQARLCWGNLLMKDRDYVQAESVLDQLVDEPKLPKEFAAMAWGALGQSLEEQSKWNEAQQAYGRAVSSSGPNNAALWQLPQARMYRLAGNQELAIQMYGQVYQGSNNPYLKSSAAQALLEMGQDISQLVPATSAY